MTIATSSRIHQLLALLPRGGSVIPRDLVDVALADRLLDLVIAGAGDAELAAACEGRTYRDGYAIRPLAAWHWGELRRLVLDGRYHMVKVTREADELTRQRDAIAALLTTERTVEP